ncbi:constitutive coactivator of peroxisome proliferator-activated receptor gamma-like isoform X2 [Zootermopsis nevadensis]|uniref:constitutive coactivator of peroxisome proliferator-activated receptor gamma-like isoform X2 n=1 Tax=Zootermopsis nevadensis TaxID=136037 RepID=UPI000B8E8B6A|nr:constitutive coactivator of peroxisome proliferator-activated receptor gamma-like isoform X2 [Zootermopsis nevadensis]
MGVIGLQTYMTNYCPDACYEVRITGLINSYRKATGRQPVIVVDGSSCIRHLYGPLDWILGGQLKEFADKLVTFVKAFESLGAKLVFFFDGSTVERKRPVWIERRLKYLQDVFKIYDCLNKWRKLSSVDLSLFQMPAGLGTRYILKELCNCEVYSSIRECDEEVAEYARDKQCFAILGEDTDYIIHEGAEYYLSISKLNLSTMTTLYYNRWALARDLAISPAKLPLLASVIGNDIVRASELKEFHYDICRYRGGRKYNMNRRIPFDDLFRHVARFVRSLPCGQDMFRAMPAIAQRVLGSKDKAEKLNTSIRSYCTQHQPVQQVDDLPKDHWSQLMSFARRRHVCCENPYQVFAVMNEQMFESCTPMEDIRELDIPPAAVALRPLRQRIYGLLLHEKPKTGHEPVVVTEWCMHGDDSIELPALVEPVTIQDPPHPGLLTLWQNGSEELRWRVFCAAVSPRLDHRLLRELSPHLVVPAAVLAYLYHEVSDHLLETWEIEALIIQAVVLEEYDVKRLSNLQVPSIHTRAIRISTLFIRSATTMHLLLATCGYPVTLAEALPWRYFDGKLFGCTYHKTMSGGKYEDQCFHKTAVMEQYIKVREIVYGPQQN